jgi:pyrroline-5-carboxylate reductase
MQVFAELKGSIKPDALVLSIMAGVPLDALVNGLGT